MSTARRLHYNYAEYLSTLRDSDLKLEYWAGVIYAIAGGTIEHAALAAKVIELLGARLPSGCRALSSDMKVRIASSDVTVFPDASVVCGKPELAPGDKLSISNPGLIVEVSSPSTDDYDRGEKLDQYKLIKSLQAVWIVSHKKPRVTVVERHKKEWREADFGPGDLLTLHKPLLTIEVDAIYRALDGL